MSTFQRSKFNLVLLLTGSVILFQLTGCKETASKPSASKGAQKTSGDSLPSIPNSDFPSAAKNRMALKDISEDLWTLQSFSSVTQAIDGKDQLYVASSFPIPHNGKILSECNATGKFATILLKKLTAIRLAAQVPTQINLGSKDAFQAIYTLRYGAMVDLEAAGCTPSFQWQKATNPEGVVELLSGLDDTTLVERTSKTSGSNLQAAITQSKDELVLHYKTESKDTVTTTKFIYTRDAKPVTPELKPEIKPASPEVKPEDKTENKEKAPAEEDSDSEKKPDLPYGIHD